MPTAVEDLAEAQQDLGALLWGAATPRALRRASGGDGSANCFHRKGFRVRSDSHRHGVMGHRREM
jgi:hypothetical protein